MEDQVCRLALHLMPDDIVEEEETRLFLALCREPPWRLNAHYLNW